MRVMEYACKSCVEYRRQPVMAANSTGLRIALYEHIKAFGRMTRENNATVSWKSTVYGGIA